MIIDTNEECRRLCDDDPTLRELRLRGKLNSFDVRWLSNALKENRHLQALSLKSTSVDGRSVRFLANVLRQTDSVLRVLDLSCNAIDTAGAIALAEAIRHNRSLLTLNLRNNRIGVEGMRALSYALMNNYVLTKLDVTQNTGEGMVDGAGGGPAGTVTTPGAGGDSASVLAFLDSLVSRNRREATATQQRHMRDIVRLGSSSSSSRHLRRHSSSRSYRSRAVVMPPPVAVRTQSVTADNEEYIGPVDLDEVTVGASLTSSFDTTTLKKKIEEPKTKAVEQEQDVEDRILSGPPPHELLCPISGDIMVDPVIAADGHSYERCNIERWFRECQYNNPKNPQPRSPKTNADMPSLLLIPNYALRSLCEANVVVVLRSQPSSSSSRSSKERTIVVVEQSKSTASSKPSVSSSETPPLPLSSVRSTASSATSTVASPIVRTTSSHTTSIREGEEEEEVEEGVEVVHAAAQEEEDYFRMMQIRDLQEQGMDAQHQLRNLFEI